MDRFTDLDDDHFPTCTAARVGTTHTDYHRSTYIRDHLDDLS